MQVSKWRIASSSIAPGLIPMSLTPVSLMPMGLIAMHLILVGCAHNAPPVANQPVANQSAPNALPIRYLDTKSADMMSLLPPAPLAGSAIDDADRRIFRETRVLEGSPRWQMASDDADLSSAQMLRHFSCSLDIELTPQQAPKLLKIASSATRDAAQTMGKAKDFYKRKRPFLIDEGPICRRRAEVENVPDYPSGHATAGWSWALVLAQVAPDHALKILERGRAIGDSRIFCGVHNVSAVDSARSLTGAIMAVVTATAEYQSDLQQARAELAALRSAPHTTPEASRCEAEAKLVAMTIGQ